MFVEQNCDDLCEIPEVFESKGYIYSCFDVNEIGCKVNGSYVCQKNFKNGNIVIGDTCEVEYVCSIKNCSFKCINNVCTEVSYNFFYVLNVIGMFILNLLSNCL